MKIIRRCRLCIRARGRYFEHLIACVMEGKNRDTTDYRDVLAPLPPPTEYKWKIVWQNVIVLTALHLGAVYGVYACLAKAMWTTNLFAVFLFVCSGFGIAGGAHRLWAHKSYKARLPLHLLLVFFNAMAFQESVLTWVRNHRTHHKHSDTDADPHNATRGFFFSHIGWLFIRSHPDVIAKGKAIDMSDLKAEPLLRFQHKYYWILMPVACFILPTYVPTLWGESAWNAFFVCAVLRYVYGLNVAFLVNSAAHKWGDKPYDKNIQPRENMSVSFFALGEGFHNYHHTFPWDYKTNELGQFSWNFTKVLIDTMAKIGWAYDLKSVSPELIEERVKKTGDSSHEERQSH